MLKSWRIKVLKSWRIKAIISCVLLLFAACNDDSGPRGTGEVDFEITDAPVDDAGIKSVVVTVAEVKVDGKSISGFTRQTIDLKAYQDGQTKLLGSTELDARTYSNLSLVLDLNKDDQGNEPGCYVQDVDNAKFALKSTASGMHEIAVAQAWQTMADAKTNVVLDFDLRKSIQYSGESGASYVFVADNKLNNAVRVTTRQASGTVRGTYQDEANVDADMIVVYAYKKGSFDAATETQAQGEGGLQFENAVASAVVREGLTGRHFTLAYLPVGEYELHFAAYSQDTSSGAFTLEAMLESETTAGASIANIIKVEASAEINLTTRIMGII